MKKLLCLLLAAVMLFSVTGCEIPSPKEAEFSSHRSQTGSGLKVHFIDVGQGDSILLESDGEFVLIDAGEFDNGPKVLEYIQNTGASSIKYMIATHPHSDHIGGLRAILDGIATENFITSETDADTSVWTKTLKKVEDLKIKYIDAVPESKYTFGNSSFTILGPLYGKYDGYNNYSVVIKAECGDISFLLTGDAEHDELHEILDAGKDLSADVLKCGHHGSDGAINSRFLKDVDPAFAVISCGKNNDYGHPDKETIELLEMLGTGLFRTDIDGTISFYTDGKNLSAESLSGKTAEYTAGEKHTDTERLYYICNKSSMVFHEPTCEGGKNIKAKNRVIIPTWEEVKYLGYTPCSHCNP